MKILVLYRPSSEWARATETFIRDFQMQHASLADRLEIVDYDSRDGQATASLYDVMAHPAVLVLGNDGHLVKDWREGSLPRSDEVANYAFSATAA